MFSDLSHSELSFFSFVRSGIVICSMCSFEKYHFSYFSYSEFVSRTSPGHNSHCSDWSYSAMSCFRVLLCRTVVSFVFNWRFQKCSFPYVSWSELRFVRLFLFRVDLFHIFPVGIVPLQMFLFRLSFSRRFSFRIVLFRFVLFQMFPFQTTFQNCLVQSCQFRTVHFQIVCSECSSLFFQECPCSVILFSNCNCRCVLFGVAFGSFSCRSWHFPDLSFF